MRIGGLASGIDTDSIVQDLMRAERIPLDKMEQDRQRLEWQRDAYREINTKLFELDEMAFDLKLESNFNTKSFQSSQGGAVTASGGAGASEGSYAINVQALATSAMNVSGMIDINSDISKHYGETYKFYTFDEEGIAQPHEFTVNQGDTISDVIERINDDSDNNIRMFYDDVTNQVVMETTRTGQYNPGGNTVVTVDDESINNNGAEILFDKDNNSFFTEVLNLQAGKKEDGMEGGETGGANATFTYNNYYTVETTENSHTINGVTFEFTGVTNGNATVNVQNDTDATIEKITEFVDKYNELIDTINGALREERYRDYPPLTDAQREEMDEGEIELWEERAKSGLLRSDPILSSALGNLRQNWYSSVDTGGTYTALTQVGITTTSDYMDGGKLEIDEEQLREALATDAQSVFNLFSNSEEGESLGLLNQLENTLDDTMSRINDRAGRGSDTLENYSIGRRIKDVDDRISRFEDRLTQIEDRYWRQFSQMEQAISMMNQQSAMLTSFGSQ